MDAIIATDRARARRREKGLTQAQVASALGVRQSAISQWEMGTTTPTLDNLLHLARVLDVDLTELVAVA